MSNLVVPILVDSRPCNHVLQYQRHAATWVSCLVLERVVVLQPECISLTNRIRFRLAESVCASSTPQPPSNQKISNYAPPSRFSEVWGFIIRLFFFFFFFFSLCPWMLFSLILCFIFSILFMGFVQLIRKDSKMLTELKYKFVVDANARCSWNVRLAMIFELLVLNMYLEWIEGWLVNFVLIEPKACRAMGQAELTVRFLFFVFCFVLC